jgi:hypothetical protein
MSFSAATIPDAICDRLVHDAHVVWLKGPLVGWSCHIRRSVLERSLSKNPTGKVKEHGK